MNHLFFLRSIFTPKSNLSFQPALNQVCGKKTSASISLPPPPKKVGNAYGLYVKAEVEKYKNSHSPTDAFKIIAESWGKLQENQKNVYRERAKVDSNKFKEEMEAYKKSLTPEQLELFNSLKDKKKLEKERKKAFLQKKEKEAQFGKPKFPGGVFVSYITSLKQGDKPYKDFVAEASRNWKNMPSHQRDVFLKDYQLKLNNYKNQLEEWEKRMLKLGEKDLVRKSTIDNIKS